MAQLNGEKLVAVLLTADEFRAAVSALCCFDGKEIVSFQTITLQDCCVPLFLKNPSRGKPEGVVREKFESLNIYVVGVMQVRSSHREQNPTKNCPPNTHFIVSVARGP